MKKILLILVLLFPYSKVHAQGWQWARGEAGMGTTEGYCVTTDKWGNIFCAGTATGSDTLIFSNDTAVSCLGIVKYDSLGNVLWAGGNMSTSAPINIVTDLYGNLYLLGVYWESYLYINGEILYNDGYSDTLSQYFIVKYNPSGNLLWAENVGNVGFNLGSHAVNDYLYFPNSGGIVSDTAGNIYITGEFNNNPSIGVDSLTNTGYCDIFLARYDSAGNAVWAEGFKGSNNDYSTGIAISQENQIYIAGLSYSPNLSFNGTDTLNTPYDLFVCRFNTDGHEVWAKKDGGSSTSINYEIGMEGIATDKAGDVYVTGIFNLLYIGSDTLAAVGSSNTAGFLAKVDSTGNIEWVKKMAGTSFATAYGVATDQCDNVWVAGGLRSDITIDDEVIHLTTIHEDDMYMAGWNSIGHLFQTATLASGGDDFCAISCDHENNIYIGGDHISPFVFQVGDTLSDTLIEGLENMYVAKYTYHANIDTVAMRQIVCRGDSVLLQAPPGYASYLWGNGSTTGSISVHTDGINVVTGAGLCIFLADTFTVISRNASDSSYIRTDTFICAQTSVVLTAPNGYSSYVWINGSSGTSISVNSIGTYWVICDSGIGCNQKFKSDSFFVDIKNPDTTVFKTDTSICPRTSVVLNAPLGYTIYKWNDSSAGNRISVTDSGTYWVLCDSGLGCDIRIYMDTFWVRLSGQDLPFSLGPDTFACSSFQLHVPGNRPSYLWQDGSSGNDYTVGHTGIYYCTASERGCNYADTIAVTIPDLLQHFQDTTICTEFFREFKVSANIPSGAACLWNTGSGNPEITISEAGNYQVTVTDSVCSAVGNMTVTTVKCGIIIHDVLTPNGDGYNDAWVIEGIEKYPGNTVQVFDKYGDLVYSKNGYNNDWEGRANNGNLLPDGTYFYLIKLDAVTLSSGEQNVYTGSVLIKR